MLQSIQQPSVVLNERRHVVYANQSFVELSGASSVEAVIGRTADEALARKFAAHGSSVRVTVRGEPMRMNQRRFVLAQLQASPWPESAA